MSGAPELLLLLERRLAALKKTRTDSSDALAVQETLIRTALESARPPEVRAFPFPRELVASRLRQGVPLLHEQPVHVDINFAADLFSRLVNVLQQRDEPELRQGLETLVSAATGGALDPERLFVEAFVQHPEHVAEIASGAGLDAELLMAVSSWAVAPLLRGYAQRLLPLMERADDGTVEGAAWTRGYCPICGGWPLLGELRGIELAQWLRCAACGSGWRGQRLACPYCDNTDYRTLGALAIEDDQRFRIAVCERCKGYLKVGNAFDPPPAELLALDDVVSVHLDVAAIERGYHRPTGSGFTIELAVPEEEWMEELA
jgi:FdhE protein